MFATKGACVWCEESPETAADVRCPSETESPEIAGVVASTTRTNGSQFTEPVHMGDPVVA
jgi:hypothetical protein